MECTAAQELLSAAHDGEAVAAESLDAARSHCAGCAECTAFVSLLGAMDAVAGDVVPPDLVATILRGVEACRQEDALLQAARLTPAQEAHTQADAQPLPDTEPAPARTWGELLSRAFSQLNRTEVVAWIAAAAVVFVAAGIGGIAGMRSILVPAPPSADTIVLSGAPESGSDAAQDMRAGALSAETKATDPAASAAASAAATDARFIVLDGIVYRLVGELDPEKADEELASTQPAGSVSSALDSGVEQSYPAKRTSDGALVYLASATARWKFERVVRSFNGRMYVLRSGSIEAYGNWPSWPSGIPRPVGDDGGADFVSQGTDDLGARVHAPVGYDAASGIAIAPSSATGDPVAGSGVWTWWEPAATR